MEVTLNNRSGRGGIILSSALCALLLYFPWGYILHTGISVPGYAGWGIFGVVLVVMAARPPIVFYRSPLLLPAALMLSLPLLPLWWSPEQADLWSALMRVLALWGGTVMVLWLGGGAAVRIAGLSDGADGCPAGGGLCT